MCRLLILLLAFLSPLSLTAQCSIEAPIDSPPCNICAPDGWEIASGTPTVGVDGGFWGGGTFGCIYLFQGTQQYDGGSVSHMQGGESITTTIDGLTPGVGYVIGFEWKPVASDCPIGGYEYEPDVSISFTIDGNTDIIPWSGPDFEEYIHCFTASSSSIEVTILHVLQAGICQMVVDYIPTEELDAIQTCGDCCNLFVETDDSVEVCPDEPFVFPGIYTDAVGSVNITWECDQPDGLDYLDDPSTLNPTFLYPLSGDNTTQIYNYTLYVEDDLCIRDEEFTIEVSASFQPIFTIELCAYDDLGDLPTLSENGFTGTWTGPNDFDVWAGSATTFTFTLDPGQDNCVESKDFDFFINETMTAEFFLLEEYCSTENINIILPLTSDNGIEGFWSTADFNPSNLPIGNHDFYFYANEPLCYLDYELTINITDGFIPTFSLPTTLCSEDLPFVYPTLSEDGYEGTWQVETIDEIFNDFETISNIFTPNDPNCVSEVTTQITVELINTPIFSFDLVYCETDDIIALNPTSDNGLMGIWNPQQIDPGTSIGTNTLEWTPINPDACINNSIASILIEPSLAYDFSLVNEFCIGEAFVFPTTSDNGMVTGTWTIPDLSSITEAGTFNNTFIPDPSLCANEFTFGFESIEEIIPEFDIPGYLCAESVNFTLPLNSINNITGSWNVDEINIQNSLGQIIALQFTPDNTDCSDVYETTIQVYNELEIAFEIEPPSDCLAADGVVFIEVIAGVEYSIDGGVTWIDQDNFSDLEAGTYLLLARYKDAPDCIQSTNLVINSLANPQANIINLENNTSCVSPNGIIEIMAVSLEAMEYSIDLGTTWQTSTNFENLDAADYSILIRFVNAPTCENLLLASIIGPTPPIIDEVNIEPVSDCLSANGSLVVQATGDNLEYSIDGGISWQADPLFENLSEGTYQIFVRPINTTDCTVEQLETIEPINLTEIISSESQNPSDCGLEDGFILVDAMGMDLSYSIDGGNTWQDSPLFENLPAGDYELLVSSGLLQNCETSKLFTLLAPNQPVIDFIYTVDPTECLEIKGIIDIYANGSNLEYSIDNGLTWQSSQIFENLQAGDYDIIIRDESAPTCFATESISLMSNSNLLQVLTYEFSNPSDCGLTDGWINIIGLTDVNCSISIDGGITYQDSPLFENLPTGEHVFDVIIHSDPNCNFQTSLFLHLPDCPCPEYDLNYNVIDVSCNNQDLGSIEVLLQDEEKINWSNGFSGSTFQDLNTGWHSFTIIYENGNCFYTDSIFVDQEPEITFDLFSSQSGCDGDATGIIEIINLSGGSGNYEYNIDLQAPQTSTTFNNLASGEYTISVMDNNGCIATQDISITVYTQVEFGLEDFVIISFGDSTYLNPIIDDLNYSSFEWTPLTDILNPGEINALVAPPATTSYTLSIYYDNCLIAQTIEVIVETETDIFVPNVIDFNSPENNVFYPMGAGNNSLEILQMSIFDRWGNRVFSIDNPSINNPADGWRPDVNLSQGVYVYHIELDNRGDIFYMSGDVTVLK